MISVVVSICPNIIIFSFVLLTWTVDETHLWQKVLTACQFLHFQVPKKYPFNNLYLERGGDPNKEPPTDEDLDPRKRLIPHNFYGS